MNRTFDDRQMRSWFLRRVVRIISFRTILGQYGAGTGARRRHAPYHLLHVTLLDPGLSRLLTGSDSAKKFQKNQRSRPSP